jgi:predicted nucleic acid-binding protein
MSFVIDASVTLAWLFEDEVSEYADRVVARLRSDSAITPTLWTLEVANGLFGAEQRRRLSVQKIVGAVQLCLQLPVSVIDTPPERALGSVLDLARSQKLTVYDAAYLDLAMREGLPLATLDEDLKAAARRVGVTSMD